MNGIEARTYRFGDANRPGLVLGLSTRQAVPMIAGVLWLAGTLQTPLPWPVGLVGPAAGLTVAFGRLRGSPLAETVLPGIRLVALKRFNRHRWLQPPLLGEGDPALPEAMRGLSMLEVPARDAGTPAYVVVRDRATGCVSAVVRVHGRGFPLAGNAEQDAMLSRWGDALSPFARDRSPVSRVTWQEWTHPVGLDRHRAFLTAVGIDDRADGATADYLALLDQQAPVTVAHDVLVTVTVDQRRVRRRRRVTSQMDAAVETLADEVRLFTARLDAAGLSTDSPLAALELTTAVRLRSDPTRAAQVTTLSRSLAVAAGRGALAWGPMTVEPDWGHVRVDGVIHRSYRIAVWPQLPVGSDWMAALLTSAQVTRTITVVMEPVSMPRAARAADREVMAREADAELKERKGFRVNARERKRLADVADRERELAEGHAEFRFVGIVTVTATNLDELDEACADVEQSAAQSLLDLRPLDARHPQAWVASLPLGRNIAPSGVR